MLARRDGRGLYPWVYNERVVCVLVRCFLVLSCGSSGGPRGEKRGETPFPPLFA